MIRLDASRRLEACIVVGIASLFVVPTDASAYLDPGAGSLIFQATVGAVLTGVVTLRMYWVRIRSYFGGRRDKPATGPK